jgi:hypothetical protein
MLRQQFACALILTIAFVAAASPSPAASSTSAMVAQIDTACAKAEAMTRSRPSAIFARTDTMTMAHDPWHKISESTYHGLVKTNNTTDDLALIWMNGTAVRFVQLASRTPQGKSLASYCYRPDGTLAMVAQDFYHPVQGYKRRQTIYVSRHGTVLVRERATTAGDPMVWADVHELPFYHALGNPT